MTEQEKREKIIKELGSCVEYFASRVKGVMFDEWIEESRKAIALLKAQQPRVMTPADVCNIGPEDICAFVEIREETHMYACYMHRYDETHTEIMCDVPGLTTKLQKGYARLWTARPTDEQRKAAKWDDV